MVKRGFVVLFLVFCFLFMSSGVLAAGVHVGLVNPDGDWISIAGIVNGGSSSGNNECNAVANEPCKWLEWYSSSLGWRYTSTTYSCSSSYIVGTSAPLRYRAHCEDCGDYGEVCCDQPSPGDSNVCDSGLVCDMIVEKCYECVGSPDCNDNNPCTDDSCVTGGLCQNTNDNSNTCNSCSSGNCKCSAGSCVDDINCVDSDGGKDWYTRGSVTDPEYNNGNPQWDYCTGSGETLGEYWCFNDAPLVSEYNCANEGKICSGDRCIEDNPSCSCPSYTDQSCGGSGPGISCNDNEMYQTRSCTPNGCRTERKCNYCDADCRTANEVGMCGDGIDNDCDGDTNCDDDDCSGDPACTGGGPTCGSNGCEVGEDPINCPADCSCGDGVCSGSVENCGGSNECPQDCCTPINPENDICLESACGSSASVCGLGSVALEWQYDGNEVTTVVEGVEVDLVVDADSVCADDEISRWEILDDSAGSVEEFSLGNLDDEGQASRSWEANQTGEGFYFEVVLGSFGTEQSPDLEVSEPCYYTDAGTFIESCDDYNDFPDDQPGARSKQEACVQDCAFVGVKNGGKCRWDPTGGDDGSGECFFSTYGNNGREEDYFCRHDYEELSQCSQDQAFRVIRTNSTKLNESDPNQRLDNSVPDCYGSCNEEVCNIESPCPKVVQLPFFTVGNVIGIVIILILVYILIKALQKENTKKKVVKKASKKKKKK
jgi:hypothetical protein